MATPKPSIVPPTKERGSKWRRCFDGCGWNGFRVGFVVLFVGWISVVMFVGSISVVMFAGWISVVMFVE